jgi:hypothetical protein
VSIGGEVTLTTGETGAHSRMTVAVAAALAMTALAAVALRLTRRGRA